MLVLAQSYWVVDAATVVASHAHCSNVIGVPFTSVITCIKDAAHAVSNVRVLVKKDFDFSSTIRRAQSHWRSHSATLCSAGVPGRERT